LDLASLVEAVASTDLPTWLVDCAVVTALGIFAAVAWRLTGRLRRLKALGVIAEFGEATDEDGKE